VFGSRWRHAFRRTRLLTSRSFLCGSRLAAALFSDPGWLLRTDDCLIHILRFGAAPCGVGGIRRKIAAGRLVSSELTFLPHRASSGVGFFAGTGLSRPQSLASDPSTGSPLSQDDGRLIGLTRVAGIPTQGNEKSYSDGRYGKRVRTGPPSASLNSYTRLRAFTSLRILGATPSGTSLVEEPNPIHFSDETRVGEMGSMA
jgi:hypothetical protein